MDNAFFQDNWPPLPDDIAKIPAEQIANPEMLALLRKAFADSQYRMKPGDASRALRIVYEKLDLVPGSRMDPELAPHIAVLEATVQLWRLDMLSEDETLRLFREHLRALLEIEGSALIEVMPSVAAIYEGRIDPLLRWMNAAIEGFRTAREKIGDGTMKVVSGQEVEPTIGAWITDYERFATNHPSRGTVMLADYVAKSPNAQRLSESDRRLLAKALNWFNMLRFGEKPAPVLGETRLPKSVQSPRQPAGGPAFVRPQSLRRAEPPVEPPSSKGVTTRLQVPPAVNPLERVRERLKYGSAFFSRIEEAEGKLPPFSQSTMSQLATLIRGTLNTKTEATRSLAGIFQVARNTGLEAVYEDPVFRQLIKETVQAGLQTQLRVAPDLAKRAVEHQENRDVLLKEFFRIFLTRATGESMMAARAMIHLASIVPEAKAGQEGVFVFFDVTSDQFSWMPTIVSDDGLLRNESASS